MTAEKWPTEAAATAAVDVAARKAHEIELTRVRGLIPPTQHHLLPEWEQLGSMDQLALRERVLPLVWAALEALPDPRFGAWQAGKNAAMNSHPSHWNHLENPYPLPTV